MSTFSILHFNDVYEVEGRDKEPVGGADRFKTMVNSFSHLNPLILFSGDAFSPSTIGNMTRGKHIPPVLNAIGVHYATLGNHDFDFGIDRLLKLKEACNFPWFLANIVDDKGIPISNAEKSKLIEWNGVKVGLLGLAEADWLDSLPTLPKTTKYLDQVEIGKQLCAQLRAEGAQLIVAITHSRAINDIHLAKGVEDIDIIVGGHDHDYYLFNANNIPILNSGSNFLDATLITINLHSKNVEKKDFVEQIVVEGETNWEMEGPNANFKFERIIVDSKYDPDPDLSNLIKSFSSLVEAKKKKILCISETQLNAKFSMARSQEVNLGNFITDIMRKLYSTDIAFLTGGTIRSDDLFGPGDITYGEMMNIFPFIDPTAVFELRGKFIKEALENGVSKVPVMEGRFPQISGLWVVYDPNAEPNNRVLEVYTGDTFETRTPLIDEKIYIVASKPYLMCGGDGYLAFKNREKVLVDEETGIPALTLIQNYCTISRVCGLFAKENVLDIARRAFLSKDKSLHYRTRISPKVEGRILTLSQYNELLTTLQTK